MDVVVKLGLEEVALNSMPHTMTTVAPDVQNIYFIRARLFPQERACIM